MIESSKKILNHLMDIHKKLSLIADNISFLFVLAGVFVFNISQAIYSKMDIKEMYTRMHLGDY